MEENIFAVFGMIFHPRTYTTGKPLRVLEYFFSTHIKLLLAAARKVKRAGTSNICLAGHIAQHCNISAAARK